MFDDEANDDWLSAANEPEPEPPKPAEEAAPAGSAAAARKASRHFAPETEVLEHPKKQLNKHWARPRFLQYDYLYNYMHNYYDDYIDYLDNRMKGYEVEPPRPQTWAERALRTYTRNTYPHSLTYKLPRPQNPDAALLNTPHWANTWHSEHSKDYYNRKYKAILF